ncbi:Eisosome protein 1 [Penicillium paradoxum]|uniref:Eisosome protein 1 n=1 Tax=Penicillium paradoxum TaxID=176176 RepID=UPI002547E810|nr:Eisosome protein 1 [Penicillium paradoxum]KAJ5774599.1 Eisosome protein 1 [Penicillium paradoxum]
MATAQQLPAGRTRLADDAATAALYVTHPQRRASVHTPTATNTQYFNPRSAVTPNLSHASAASALAHANRKPVEVWRPPTRLPAAEKAAFCVKDFSPPQQPQPSTQYSAHGLGAAVLAVREQRASISQASVSSVHRRGSSTDRYHHTAVGGNPQEKALQAATGAYTLSRKRADSAPSDPGVPSGPPHARLATGTSRPSRVEEEDHLGHLNPAMEASRIQHIANANAKLYTSSPPVQSEIEARNYKNSLRAAAISMANDMYKANETKRRPSETDPAIAAAQKGQSQLGYRKTVSAADGSAVRRAIALQDAAHKRAAEKLARMQDENADYREYYGTPLEPQRSRLTSRRKRTSSDADVSQMDAEQSRQIRSQMTTLRTKLDRVDVKRTQDREMLMQAARRNVNQTIQDMEARVYADTGRAPPSLQREWDEVAQERVRQEAETFELTTAQSGRVNIGGQQFMDMADIEAVARARLQPALDEITEDAETRRAQELEARLDAEEKQRYAAVERQREAEVKALEKQEKGTSKRDNKSESKIPKFFLWRKKGKRARVEESETEGAQAVSPVPQEAVEEQAPATTSETDVSRESIPEVASVETDTADAATPVAITPVATVPSVQEPETSIATVSSAPETETPALVEEGEPEAIPRRPVRSQTDPLAFEQQDAAATPGPAIVHYFTPPTTSPRADSKLKNWFRDRLVRRSSGPMAVYPHQPGPDLNSDSEPAFQGGAALTGRDESRGAALRSHPLGMTDTIPTHNRSSSYYNNDLDVTKINSVESSPEFSKPNGNGRKRDRLRKSFLKTISGSSDEPASNGASRRASEIPAQSKEFGAADIQSLRDSAIEQGLPVPPPLGDAMSAKRESRFSEDL